MVSGTPSGGTPGGAPSSPGVSSVFVGVSAGSCDTGVSCGVGGGVGGFFFFSSDSFRWSSTFSSTLPGGVVICVIKVISQRFKINIRHGFKIKAVVSRRSLRKNSMRNKTLTERLLSIDRNEIVEHSKPLLHPGPLFLVCD